MEEININETTLKNEQALLGLALQDKEIAIGIFKVVNENDFYYSKHKIIAKLIKKLTKTEIDLVQLLLEAQKQNVLLEIGGEVYIVELNETAINAKNWKFYAKQVKQQSLERKKQELSILIKNNPEKDLYVKELVKTQEEIDKLQIVQVDLRDWANSLRREIFTNKNIIHTGYNGIDQSAMAGGDLVVVAARPGVGKSILAANVLNNFLKQNKKCLVYTTEMTPEQYMLRQICIYANLWYFGFRNGYAQDQDKENLDEATTEFTDKYKDLLIYSPTLRPSSDDIKREIAEYEPEVVILDNLSSVKLTSKNTNKPDKIGEFLEEVKEVIVDKKLLCIVVCHINRTAEKEDGNNEPILSNLKDSSKIEELANKVIIMWPSEKSTLTEMAINWKYSKDRDGLGGFGLLMVNKNFLTMRDANDTKG
jgi:replicative DNA helicase